MQPWLSSSNLLRHLNPDLQIRIRAGSARARASFAVGCRLHMAKAKRQALVINRQGIVDFDKRMQALLVTEVMAAHYESNQASGILPAATFTS